MTYQQNKIIVKTDYVPDHTLYLTANKLYEGTQCSDTGKLYVICADDGETIYIYISPSLCSY